jgi:endonuclease-3
MKFLPESITVKQSRMLRIIARKFPVKVWKAGSPFETLVQTILSQNTNDRNSEAAMTKLRRRFKINPRTLSKASLRDLIPCIKQAGLYRSKAPRIKETSRIIQEEYGGRLSPFLNLPYQEAKERLTSLPGVGPKTADILLAFVAKNPVIPVDTHIARVSKRLGIVPTNANYEKTRLSLERLIPPQRRVSVHLSIIEFGREICRAPRPRCSVCPISKLCPSSTV